MDDGFAHFGHQHPLSFKLTRTFKRCHQHRREFLVANITMWLTSLSPFFWQEWCWWQSELMTKMTKSVTKISKISPVFFSTEQVTNNKANFLEITRLFSEDDYAENNCFDGKNLYAYPCRGKCFQYIGLYESNVI